MNYQNLIILPNLKAQKLPKKQVIITQKFLSGVLSYKDYWTGNIKVLMQESSTISDNLDNISVNIEELPFQLEIIDFNDQKSLINHFGQNSLVLGSIEYTQNHISQVCQTIKIPCIYVTEYNLKTRMQIINATVSNPLLRLRKYLWENNQERKHRKAISLANGLQCNGYPTYNSYSSINDNALLYFDSRLDEELLATNEIIERKYENRLEESSLRLLFSGRLNKIKGADHLLKVAQELMKLGVNYKMYICGDGELKQMMQNKIIHSSLNDYVTMKGVLEFRKELVPFVKENIDLFVCCHRQGDPSCTYLETMSCGVPIIGYDNEAFAGIVKYSGLGWLVEMDKPKLMAQKIAELSKNRETIKQMSLKGLEFCKQNTFEKTFQKRILHMERTINDFYLN